VNLTKAFLDSATIQTALDVSSKMINTSSCVMVMFII